MCAVTFQLPKGHAGTTLVRFFVAVPSRGRVHGQALGTAGHQLILHLKSIRAAWGQHAIWGHLYGYANRAAVSQKVSFSFAHLSSGPPKRVYSNMDAYLRSRVCKEGEFPRWVDKQIFGGQANLSKFSEQRASGH